MIADAFPCKAVLLFSTSEALFMAVQSDGEICEFLLKAVPTRTEHWPLLQLQC